MLQTTHSPIVAPVGGSAGGIDQGELELARTVKVRAASEDAPLVVNELRHLRAQNMGDATKAE